jgi:hypothetical protein
MVLSSDHEYPSIAAQVALLGREGFVRELLDDLGSLVPVYLRRPEAEMRKTGLSY